jgi:hypothetical protein
MSNQFKFLGKSGDNSSAPEQEDAAQSFLEDKLAKNKYTIAQEDTGSSFDPSRYTTGQLDELESNGGPKDFNSQYNKVISNQDELDAANEYNAGLNTSQLTGEQIRDKFGFSYNEEHASKGGGFSKYGGRDDGAIYNNKTGEYIGSIDNFTPRGKNGDAQGIDKFQQVQSYGLEHGFRAQARSDWDSMNDVAGAVNDIVGEAPVKKAVPTEKTELVKIENSPEIKQAKERVQTYENDVLSGKTSEDIYQTGSNDKYSFDAAKGAAGIGTPMNGDSKEQADKATASFLDNKKSQVKNQYQFQAQG